MKRAILTVPVFVLLALSTTGCGKDSSATESNTNKPYVAFRLRLILPPSTQNRQSVINHWRAFSDDYTDPIYSDKGFEVRDLHSVGGFKDDVADWFQMEIKVPLTEYNLFCAEMHKLFMFTDDQKAIPYSIPLRTDQPLTWR